MQIDYAATYDARDVSHWSGTGYYIAKALADQGAQLSYFAPEKKTAALRLKVKRFWYELVLKKRYLLERDPSIIKDIGQQISEKISSSDADFVVSPGTLPIAFLKTDKPVVIWVDSIFGALNDFYPDRFDICKESIDFGHKIDQLALDNTELAIFSSQWAADYALQNYSVEKHKVKVVPFGANIDHEYNQDQIQEMVKKRSDRVCKILFIGVDWERKDGQLVFETAKELNKKGINVQLTIIGCNPPKEVASNSLVNSVGFLNKENPGELSKLKQIFADTHFFMMPTQAEAYGLVFCEANAFGVPCIAKAIGGVPTIIKNGKNGRLFEENEPVKNFSDWIFNIFNDHVAYQNLALSSFMEFKNRLNWDIAGKQVISFLKEFL